MAGFWANRASEQRAAVSAEFEHALTQEVLRTELIRIKVLVATSSLLAASLWAVYIFAPDAVIAVWRGGLQPVYSYVNLVPCILFERWVHAAIGRHLKLHRDVPVIRRYLGALIETTMPTIALALHIENMGSVQALGFVAPLGYFIFIILSTLRLDFWLSTFTGFVAAAELFGMAHFHPSHRQHRSRNLVARRTQPDHPHLRDTRGRGRSSVAPPVRSQHSGRHRARSRHRSVWPARLAAGRRAADGRRRQHGERYPPRRRHVRRFPQFHRWCPFTFPAGCRRPPGRCVRRAGRNTRPSWRHREQVFRRWISGAVRRAVRGCRRRAPRGRRGARDACRNGSSQPGQHLAAADRHRHSLRRSGRGQYRLSPAQGVHRDRRHRELCGEA